MTQRGTLDAIWIKRARRGEMDPAASAQLVAGRGLAGNANQGGRRQVTVIDRAAWDAMMSELGADIPPSVRRANLMLGGIDLRRSRGRLLQIGACRLEILGETRPCERMDEALPGLRGAMSPAWRGGVFARVLVGGRIDVGAAVSLVSPNAELWPG
jgi:MOSC domain-containing protein YiiM